MHQATQFFCPQVDCDRHTRGFAREYNMADHINRVHKELDSNEYLKKSKRSRRSVSSGTSGSVTGFDKNSSRKAAAKILRREKLEKQYQSSQAKVNSLVVKLEDSTSPSTIKYVNQIRNELAKLEEAALGLQGSFGSE